jgi:hypothetical protein
VTLPNQNPVGKATITDVNGGVIRTGDMLKASIAGVTDADGITGDIRYTWQAEFTPGTGVFEDIVLLPAGDLAFESASGVFFQANPAVDGLSLRVKATYQDANGVVEQVFSDPTAPVVVVLPPLTTVWSLMLLRCGINLVRSDLNFIPKQTMIGSSRAGPP